MKKIIGIAVLSLVLFAGCTQVGNLFNPIVGTWQVSVLGIVTTEVYDMDESCSQTITILGVGVSKVGTWTSTNDTITRVWSASDTDVVTYSFNSDNSQLTVVPTGGGIAATFDRM